MKESAHRHETRQNEKHTQATCTQPRPFQWARGRVHQPSSPCAGAQIYPIICVQNSIALAAETGLTLVSAFLQVVTHSVHRSRRVAHALNFVQQCREGVGPRTGAPSPSRGVVKSAKPNRNATSSVTRGVAMVRVRQGMGAAVKDMQSCSAPAKRSWGVERRGTLQRR